MRWIESNVAREQYEKLLVMYKELGKELEALGNLYKEIQTDVFDESGIEQFEDMKGDFECIIDRLRDVQAIADANAFWNEMMDDGDADIVGSYDHYWARAGGHSGV